VEEWSARRDEQAVLYDHIRHRLEAFRWIRARRKKVANHGEGNDLLAHPGLRRPQAEFPTSPFRLRRARLLAIQDAARSPRDLALLKAAPREVEGP